MEQGISKNQIVTMLTRSPHGKLSEYHTVGAEAAIREPEFLAHLISFNRNKGQIRDSKVALPVIALGVPTHEDFRQNALAHLALLVPRELVRALRFSLEIRTPGSNGALRRLVERYLRAKEENWAVWERTTVQHRASMKALYSIWHVKPGTMADAILFKGERPRGSMFEAIANLKDMPASEAAGTIMERRIPFLIAMGALGAKAKDTDLVLALIQRMSPAELINNTKMLERVGIKTVPALRAAYEQALTKAAGSKKMASFKASVAAEAVEDETLKAKLQDVQEKQIKVLGGVEGNWAVFGDKSGSMTTAIEVSRHVAATLAKMVKGQVHLVFFDTAPRYVDVTGKTYEEILAATKHVKAEGGTSMGCALLALAEKSVEIDGIAVVSDGGENRAPMFSDVYKAFSQAIGKEVPVYLYRTAGDDDHFSTYQSRAGIDVQKFDLSQGNVDYYSLSNIVMTMKTKRYGLLEEIMDTPLLTLEEVFDNAKKGAKEFAHA